MSDRWMALCCRLPGWAEEGLGRLAEAMEALPKPRLPAWALPATAAAADNAQAEPTAVSGSEGGGAPAAAA